MTHSHTNPFGLLITLMILVVGLQKIHIHFKDHFSTEKVYRLEIHRLQNALGRETFHHKVTQYHLASSKKELDQLRKNFSKLAPVISKCRENYKKDHKKKRTYRDITSSQAKSPSQ